MSLQITKNPLKRRSLLVFPLSGEARDGHIPGAWVGNVLWDWPSSFYFWGFHSLSMAAQPVLQLSTTLGPQSAEQ